MKYYGEDEEALGKAILHLTALGKLKHRQTTCTVLKQSFITASYRGWQGISMTHVFPSMVLRLDVSILHPLAF